MTKPSPEFTGREGNTCTQKNVKLHDKLQDVEGNGVGSRKEKPLAISQMVLLESECLGLESHSGASSSLVLPAY